MLGTSLPPGQASCGGEISLGGAMSHRRCARELVTLRNFLGNGGDARAPRKPVVIPAVRSIEHPVGGGGLILNNRPTHKRCADHTGFSQVGKLTIAYMYREGCAPDIGKPTIPYPPRVPGPGLVLHARVRCVRGPRHGYTDRFGTTTGTGPGTTTGTGAGTGAGTTTGRYRSRSRCRSRHRYHHRYRYRCRYRHHPCIVQWTGVTRCTRIHGSERRRGRVGSC